MSRWVSSIPGSSAVTEIYRRQRTVAPRWLRSVHVEWSRRLAKKPLGLAKRYPFDDVRLSARIGRASEACGG